MFVFSISQNLSYLDIRDQSKDFFSKFSFTLFVTGAADIHAENRPGIQVWNLQRESIAVDQICKKKIGTTDRQIQKKEKYHYNFIALGIKI